MQQRPTSSSRAPEDQWKINVKQKPELAPLRTVDDHSDHLPVYSCRPALPRSRSLGAEKLIHLIPLIVFFCLFILWWCSYPVKIETKDGRILAIHRIEKPQNLTANVVELAVLASATSPIPSATEVHENNYSNITEVNLAPAYKDKSCSIWPL
ncbi:hypothetical protein K2173_023537 [Erythroxylum novogranatense]|uniref:Uncharacterized protein n=1 Tax=Erythroxylum novogranatense TaxID=1862640 RepID=A0AAV8TS58_9ROSI|nr:hypothetical protein K2173_023537 [Erythroxylum novogranatense]